MWFLATSTVATCFYVIRAWIFVNSFSVKESSQFGITWNAIIDFGSSKRFKMSLLSHDLSNCVHF